MDSDVVKNLLTNNGFKICDTGNGYNIFIKEQNKVVTIVTNDSGYNIPDSLNCGCLVCKYDINQTKFDNFRNSISEKTYQSLSEALPEI